MANHNPPTNGLDKRKGQINRKGRPKAFDELRTLARSISHEPAIGKDGKPIEIDGKVVTVTEAILRSWAMSKDPRLQMHFIEVTYGKVPDKLDVTTNGQNIGPLVEVKPIDYRATIAALAPGSMEDSNAPGQDESFEHGAALGKDCNGRGD